VIAQDLSPGWLQTKATSGFGVRKASGGGRYSRRLQQVAAAGSGSKQAGLALASYTYAFDAARARASVADALRLSGAVRQWQQAGRRSKQSCLCALCARTRCGSLRAAAFVSP